MDIRNYLKKSLPHIIALLIFTSIALVYFYPVLEGRVLHTNDGTVAYNSSSEIRSFREKYGEEPLWTNAMFGGMPAFLISVKYYGNLLAHIDHLLKIMKLPLAPVFLTMAGFYIMLLLFRVDYRLAIAGAIAYGLSSYFFIIIGAGHNTKAFAIAYMAPVIGSVWYSYRENIIKGSLLLAFFLSLQILSNHPQITYYTFICILVMVISELIFSIRSGNLLSFIKKSLILIIPVLLAVGMNFSSLYTTYEYGKYSIRGSSDLITPGSRPSKGLNRDYAFQWSYGIDETFTLLIPEFKGGANRPFSAKSETVKVLKANNASPYISSFHRYWGTQPWTDGPVYAGAIVVFLFVTGLLLVRGSVKWWLAIATLVSIMLSWGKNFMPLSELFFNYFPGYNKFRAVTMILVVAEFCMPLLAILALKEILEGKVSRKNIMKALKVGAAVTGGLALLFILIPGIAGSFISPAEGSGQLPGWLTGALKKDRMHLLRADAFRSLIFIILSAGIIIAFLHKKIKKEYVIALLAFLFILDMFPVNKRYLNNDKFTSPSSVQKMSLPTQADLAILKDTTVFRVLNLTVSPFNDATTSRFHKSVGGYHGAKLKRYNELIDSVLYPEIMKFTGILQQPDPYSHIDSALMRLNGLNMMNTRYIILNPDLPPLTNPYAGGNVWFAERITFVQNASEELSATGKSIRGKEAVIDVRFRENVPADLPGPATGDTVSLKSYKPNELVYVSAAQGERLAVFSEIYYPAGWKAYIDGNEAKILRANYVLRALVIPGGNHEIKFIFRPSSYYTGEKISRASSVVFILLAAGYFVYSFRKKSV